MRIVDVYLDTDTVYLAPLGDIQYGNEAFSYRHFTRAMERLKNYNQHVPVHVIGTGDYIDFMSPSNREKYKASGLYTTAQRSVEAYAAREQVEELYSMLPTDIHYDLLVHGHHWFHYNYADYEVGYIPDDKLVKGQKPMNTDHHLALLTGAEIALSNAVIKYHFPDGRLYKVLVFHGDGGSGVYNTNGLNKLAKRAMGWDVNAVFMGHTHVAAASAIVRLGTDADDVVNENIVLVNSGSFLKGFLIGEATYVENKNMNALALGHTIVQVAPGIGSEPFEVGVNIRW